MASRAPKPTPYHPRHKRTWVRHHDRRIRQPIPTVATFLLAMPALRRDDLGRIAERAIDRMDGMEPDPDLEWSGDEFDTDNSEDEALTGRVLTFDGPGCSTSDPGGGGVDDEGEADTHYPAIPVYGIDQTQAMVNDPAREWQRALRRRDR